MPKKKAAKKATGSLRDRLLKNSKLADTDVLENSIFFTQKEMVPTPVLLLNAALSSRVDGGLTSGLTTIAGESKTFKTMFGLLMMSSYMKKHKDAVCLFYDSEFGSPPSYVENFGIDMSRVLHCPIKNVEELKFDIVNQLENIQRGDKVFIFVDSVGNLASKKEIDDALEEKSVADMTRAKQLKSVFRMVTPYLTMCDIPMVVINHTYKSIGLFPTDVVGGGTGAIYSSDTVFIVKKKQVKEGTDLAGNHFDLFIEKSRYVKEKSRIPIVVLFGQALSPYTGLFDLAKEMGYIESRKKGFFNAICDAKDAPMRRRKEIEFDKEFWKKVFADTDFAEAIQATYALGDLEWEDEEAEDVESSE